MKKGLILRLARMRQNSQNVYHDKDRKPLGRILKEFILSSCRTKSLATSYFTSFLYKKNISNYQDYLSHKESESLQRLLCDNATCDMMHNKIFFQKYFETFNVPMPRLMAYNIREKMTVLADTGVMTYDVSTAKTLLDILNKLLQLSTNNSVFIKLAQSSGGKGAIRISKKQTRESPENQIDKFYQDFLTGSYLFQDEVMQHEGLAIINPDTLNTIRIDTFKPRGGKPEILSALLRVGRAGSCVDNISSGGIYIGIDLEKGTLKESGFRDLVYGGEHYKQHPDNLVTFNGFPIPLFDEAKRLAVVAADYLPQALVGWDIAISSHGPVLIEGNAVYYGMDIMDITYGGYRNNPVFQKAEAYVKDNYEHY